MLYYIRCVTFAGNVSTFVLKYIRLTRETSKLYCDAKAIEMQPMCVNETAVERPGSRWIIAIASFSTNLAFRPTDHDILRMSLTAITRKFD